jgi:acyl-coenzyme A thioesterase PaaI-like protein
MTPLSASALVFEPDYLEGFRQIYEEKVVFNRLLGLKLVSVTPEEVVARIEMRPDLVGHYAYNRIHGGVISAVLDAIGSAAVMAVWPRST